MAKEISAEDAQTGRPSLCRDSRGLICAPLQAARVLSQAGRGPLFYNAFQRDAEAKASAQKEEVQVPVQKQAPSPPQF